MDEKRLNELTNKIQNFINTLDVGYKEWFTLLNFFTVNLAVKFKIPDHEIKKIFDNLQKLISIGKQENELKKEI